MAAAATGARYRRTAPVEALRLLVVFAGSLGALGPFLGKGLPGGTWDGPSHLYRLLDFDRAFRQGILVPRIAPDQALGYGYASFTYYSPLSLYLGEVFRLFGFGMIASLKACFVVAILAGGFGMYLLARDLFGWRSGLVAALAYVYTPYLLVDLYTRGDLAESLALGVLPFVFWSLWRAVAVDEARAAAPARGAVLGVCFATLVLFHVLIALLSAPVLLTFLLVAPRPRIGSLRRAIPSLLIGAALGLGLSAAYWLPVSTTLGNLDPIALTDGSFDYHRWFVPLPDLIQRQWAYDYGFALERGARLNLGRAQAALLVLATFWAVVFRAPRVRLLVFAAAGIAILVWLQHPSAAFVWGLVPGSRFVQFPYRLGAEITPLSALLLGGFLCVGTSVWAKRASTLMGIATLAGLIAASLVGLPRGHLTLREAEVNLPTVWQLERSSGQIAGSTRGDYMPRWVSGDFFEAFRVSAAHPRPGTATARLTALSQGPLSLVGTVDADSPTTVTFDRLYLPNWTARLDGNPVSIGPSGPLGALTIPVPAGRHQLTVEAAETPAGKAGLLLSGLGGLAVGVIFVGSDRKTAKYRLGLIVVLAAIGVAFVEPRIHRAEPLAARGIDFPGGVRLVGSALDPSPANPPGVIQVSLLWEALRAPLPDCTVHLRLVDASGRVVARRDKPPRFGARPCSAWSAGEIVSDTEQIRLPPGGTPGSYRLLLGLSLGSTAESAADGASVQIVSWHDPEQSVSEGNGVLLGEVSVPAPPPRATLPDGEPIGAVVGNVFALDSARVAVAAGPGEIPTPSLFLEPSRRLFGVLRPAPRPIFTTNRDPRFIARARPGDTLGIDLLWRALGDAPANDAVFTHLLDPGPRLVAQDDNWPDHANLPTSVWFPGDTLVDHYEITVPANTPPGVCSLTTGMYERGKPGHLSVRGSHASGDQVILGTVKVSSPNQVYGATVAPPPVSAIFGDQITLIAAGPETATVRPGGTATVNLSWQAATRPSADDTVFVHVIDDRGQVVAQHDSPPLAGAYPTSLWDPGDRVGDRIAIPIPATLPAGTYRIEVGLYLPSTGARLLTPDGSSVIIGTIRVG